LCKPTVKSRSRVRVRLGDDGSRKRNLIPQPQEPRPVAYSRGAGPVKDKKQPPPEQSGAPHEARGRKTKEDYPLSISKTRRTREARRATIAKGIRSEELL
jgi:hypothetical protein